MSGALREAGIKGLTFSSQFTGQPGNAVLSYQESTGRGSLAIDMNGNGKPDLLVITTGKIAQADIVTGGQAPTPSPRPTPTPAPVPEPGTSASLLATVASFLQQTLTLFQSLLRMLEKSHR